MTATLHRDNWEQYAAICEQKITSLEAEIERLQAALSEYHELQRLAADHRISSELIGIRVRNGGASVEQTTVIDTLHWPPSALAAIEKQRAEIERLTGEKSYLSDEVVPALRQEIERLTKERDGAAFL